MWCAVNILLFLKLEEIKIIDIISGSWSRLKGTVAREFLVSGFFHQTVPLDNRKNNFAEISIFAEIFVFKGCLAMSASPLSKF
jgi:hypothetical protein